MNMRNIRRFLILLFALALLPAGSLAQGKGQGKGKGKGHSDQDDDRSGKLPVFGERDRDLIVKYYQGGSSGLPPGLAKRGGNLPPGLERQLERNGTLPPGLQKKLQPFPPELERQLPPCPTSYQRGIIGAHIVVFNRSTRLIVDVIKNVVVTR
jgi:hypothetical protein